MSSDATALQRTPLHDSHVRLGARMVPFGGWDMPVVYDSQIAEHEAVRAACGIFDVSHMGQVRFRGAGAGEFLSWLVPGNIARLADGGSLYTTLCNEEGGVIDDLIVSRLSGEEYFAVVNAATREKDIAWMRAKAATRAGGAVTIEDESERWAMIAVQGPEALGILDNLVPEGGWSGTKPFSIHSVRSAGSDLLVSRTGYTGEDGVELLCPAAGAATWWEKLLKLGAKPCGLAARDSLRLEMGYCLYGQDLDETISPFEGGIGWTVSWKKPGDYIGRGALERQRAEGPPRTRIGLKLESRKPLRHGDRVLSDGTDIGVVTSGGYSPTANVGIGLALVDTDQAEGKSVLEVAGRGKPVAAQVVKPPFISK